MEISYGAGRSREKQIAVSALVVVFLMHVHNAISLYAAFLHQGRIQLFKL